MTLTADIPTNVHPPLRSMLVVIATSGMVYFPTHQTNVLDCAKRIWDYGPWNDWIRLAEYDPALNCIGRILWEYKP